MSDLRKLILETLSFFSPMTQEELLLGFDRATVEAHPELTMELLQQELLLLVKEGKLKKTKKGRDIAFVRLYPKRSWLRQILSFLR